MILAIGNDGQFAKFCRAADHPDLSSDTRYSTNQARVANRTTLIPTLRDITRTRSTREWITLLESVGVPCGPINNLADVFADPQVQARGLKMHMEHERAGQVPLVASPIRLSDTPVQYRQAPPVLGQHTREVMKQCLNMNDQTMNDLFAQGVLA